MECWSDGLAMIPICSTAAPHSPSPERETASKRRSRYRSNSLQLMKNWHCGLEQTKRHLWLRSLDPQTGQNSHQFSSFSSLVVEESAPLLSPSVKCVGDGEDRKRSALSPVRIRGGRCPPQLLSGPERPPSPPGRSLPHC